MGALLRVGLVGCGAIGRAHLDLWRETPGAVLAAVCDVSGERARAFAQMAAASAHTSLDEMLASRTLDAVDICTPSGQHVEQGVLCARAGVHVLCEKPLALWVDAADALIAACERARVTLASVFQRRAIPALQRVAADIHAGRIGELLLCSAQVKWWRDQAYYDSASWRGTWDLDGGVLANQAIHAIDHLCWLAGPVVDVQYALVRTAAHRMEAEDVALATVKLASGAAGSIEATTCCRPPLCTRVEVVGTRGAVAFDDATVTAYGADGQDLRNELPPQSEPTGGRSDPMSISLEGHRTIIADFAAAVRDGRPPLVDGRQARMAVEAIDRIHRAAGVGPPAPAR